MSDAGREVPDSSEEKTPQFTHAGVIQDPSLSQLRDQIKKVMIPLLIKTFQQKLELNQTLAPPSRLSSGKNHNSSEEIIEQLKHLDKDLKVLLLWCQSCRSQIQKALCPPEEEQKNPITATPSSTAHPGVSKSFANAVATPAAYSSSSRSREKSQRIL